MPLVKISKRLFFKAKASFYPSVGPARQIINIGKTHILERF